MSHIFCRSFLLLGISITNFKRHSRNVFTLKFDWIQRKLSWTLMGMGIVVMGSKHLWHLSSLQWGARSACYIRSRMGLGREHHDVMEASRGEVKLGVVVGDGEDRKKAFSMSRWIRRGHKHTHKSQLYRRFDFSLRFSSWHCWVGLTPSSETFQATRSQENQVQLKPFKIPFLLYVIIKTILKQQKTWKTKGKVLLVVSPQYSHSPHFLFFSFYPFANWQVSRWVGRCRLDS